MQDVFLRLLPRPVHLGARLAMFFLVAALIAIVLGLVTLLEITSLAPVDMEHTFVWVVLVGACLVLLMLGLCWLVLSREVLHPLEDIRKALQQEEEDVPPSSGFGQVVVQVQALRDAVHQTQEQLDKSHENLRQAEKLAMVGKLAAGVAHSVRNPLTSVKLRLFSLERSLALTPRQQEDFTVITEAMRHVDAIVSNFLEFSRRPQLQLQRVRVSAVVDATLQLLENRLAAFPVSLTIRRAPGAPAIDADPEQLREALLNILLNGCEAMDYSGALLVEEQFATGDDGTAYVCVRIQDSGPGIPPEKLADIFTPFFSTKEQGTGLGLPIAKGILQEHGGNITVESSPKTGTIFTLSLPLAVDGG